jgi:outer membrane protein
MLMKTTKLSMAPLAILVLSLSQNAAASDLLDVFKVAQANDTAVRQAQAAFLAAEQRQYQSRALLLPSADFTADTSRSEQEIAGESDNSTDWGYSVSIVHSVYDRANYNLLSQSEKLTANVKAEYEVAKQNLILRVAQSYFNVLAAMDNVNFAQSEIEANARQLEQTKQRFEVGLIAITDVHEAQAAYDLSGASEIVAKNVLISSIEALRELTGEYYENFEQLGNEIPLTRPDPEDPTVWVNAALTNNLRIIAGQFALESSRTNIKVQQAERLPTLDLIGRHSYSDDPGSNFGGDSFTDTSLMLQVSLPLYRGGGTTAKIRESEQLYNQQLATLEQVRRNVQRQARDAYASVIANISQVNALQQGIISTQSALEASQAGLEVGTRTTVDVLNTRRELFRAQRDHARARYDYLLSTLSLKEAAGSLSTQDLELINVLLN